MPADAPASHAAEHVRRFDRERYATALFAPPGPRDGLMVLYAFNLEVARVREQVREPMAGLIRLQWWRDVIAEARAGGTERGHPIAGPLAGLIRAHDLPIEPFERLLAARELDLRPDPPADLAAAEDYADATSASLVELALRVLGTNSDAARPVGVAWSLVGQLRALPFALSTGRLTLPAAVLLEFGTDVAAVQAGRAPKQALIGAVRRVAERAQEHLNAVRGTRPGQGLPALLPAVLARVHLHTLAISGFDPFDARVARPQTAPLRLLWAKLSGRI
ncbi:MAG: phytoene/squalene synthase family protein [Actinomycetota bacterium]